MKKFDTIPDSLQNWIQDAVSVIESPEKRDKEIQYFCNLIDEYQKEVKNLPEKEQIQCILDKLGSVKAYHERIAAEKSEKNEKNEKNRRQLKYLGAAALILCIIFAYPSIKIILTTDITDAGGYMNWGAGQLLGGSLAASLLWLATGILLLISGRKRK